MTDKQRLFFSGLLPETRGEESTYFDYCQQGRLMIQRCSSCDRYVFYPRGVCPECLGRLDWVEADGRGEVFTFTVHHRFPEGFEGSEPYVLAVVELREGVRMLTRVMSEPAEVVVGLEVEVAFARIDESFQVPVFVPAGSA